ncbi:MAG: DNA/RNA nuclease SfsA [Desulfobacterales bacterium]|nr:MAG: DNA/RNA nuclease SfsA [Desulfobacterales bacterium]
MNKKKYTDQTGLLLWPELIRGILIKRYKRFLADVRLDTGKIVTAHCPNTGSMQGCSEPGRPVYLSRHDDPKRKLNYTWQLIKMPGSLVGINTLVPNRLVFQSAQAALIPELAGYKTAAREVSIGNGSRIDLMLSNGQRNRCYVEIKNCTLVNDGIALFPDAVTSRGLKHLKELETLVNAGSRCVMFYLIQRMDARIFKSADLIDSEYGRGLRRAFKRGVEILAYDVCIDLSGIQLNRKIPCEL